MSSLSLSRRLFKLPMWQSLINRKQFSAAQCICRPMSTLCGGRTHQLCCCCSRSIASNTCVEHRRHLSTSNGLLRRGTRIVPPEGHGNTSADPYLPSENSRSPSDPSIKSLLEDASDPSVPPVLGSGGDGVVEWTSGQDDYRRRREQRRLSIKTKFDPTMTSVLLFPGQGTQYVGMGKELLQIPIVQQMYSVASDILGLDLVDISLNGPAKMLARTQIQQPAILVASLAAVEKLRLERPNAVQNCVATAGFSVGEIAALTFAGAFTFEDAVRLIKVRAEAMQLASESFPGGMMTAFIRTDSLLEFGCRVAKEFSSKRGVEHAECRVASYLHPNCKVVGGSEEALDFLRENMEDFKIKRLKRLNVSGAFHTDLMKPAADTVKEVLREIEIQTPLIAVHSNLDGRAYKNPDHIKKSIPRQIFSPVKWEQTMHIMYDRPPGSGFPITYECGPGRSLSTILKMVNVTALASTINIQA